MQENRLKIEELAYDEVDFNYDYFSYLIKSLVNSEEFDNLASPTKPFNIFGLSSVDKYYKIFHEFIKGKTLRGENVKDVKEKYKNLLQNHV